MANWHWRPASEKFDWCRSIEPMSAVVVGAGGLIGQALVRQGLIGIAHHEIDRPLGRIACLIFAGRDPRLGGPDYRTDDDIEWQWALRAKAQNWRFVHLGTRKVYAPSTSPSSENSPLGPIDAYGRQKLAMEERLRAELAESLLVVRIGNAFGYERGRRSFMGAMLDRLASRGEIRFDMSGAVERDFIPVDRVAQAIVALVGCRACGIVNVASGIALPTKRLAEAVIEGFGAGRLVVDDPREFDAFAMDIARLSGLTGQRLGEADILDEARAIGRRLAMETSAT